MRAARKRKQDKDNRAATASNARRGVSRRSKRNKNDGFDVAGFLNGAERDDAEKGQSVMVLNGRNRRYSKSQSQIEARFRSDLKEHYGMYSCLFE